MTIEIHVIELTKLDEHSVSLEEGGLVNWLLFLKGVDKSNWEVLAMNEPMLKKAMDTLEFLSQDTVARMEYQARMKSLSDEKTRIEGARAEGERKKAEGIAAKLLAMGLEAETIAQASGLSVQEVKALSPLQ